MYIEKEYMYYGRIIFLFHNTIYEQNVMYAWWCQVDRRELTLRNALQVEWTAQPLKDHHYHTMYRMTVQFIKQCNGINDRYEPQTGNLRVMVFGIYALAVEGAMQTKYKFTWVGMFCYSLVQKQFVFTSLLLFLQIKYENANCKCYLSEVKQ